MTKQIKETDGMSLVAAPSAQNLVLSSGGIIADNSITCKGGQATLLLDNVQCDILYSFKRIDGRPEPYFNATDFLSSYKQSFPDEKKELKEFWRRKRTQELVNLIVGKSHHKNISKYVAGEGRFKKTFIHKDLYLSLLIWLDAKYELAITQLVEMISRSGEITYQNREMLKQDTKVKNNAVKILAQKLLENYPASQAASHLYTNTQLRLNRAITGKWAKVVREELAAEQILQMDELELEVERFILKNIDSMDAKLLAYRLDTFIDNYFQRSA